MPYKCCVPKCRGNSSNGTTVSVFSFPKDEDLKKAWAKAIGRSNYIPTSSSRVCELHFREHQIERIVSMYDEKTGRTLTAPLTHPRLYFGAVPCLIGPEFRAKKSADRQKQTTPSPKRRSTRPIKVQTKEILPINVDSDDSQHQIEGNASFESINEFISKMHNMTIGDEWVVRKKEKCVKFILINDVPIPCILCYGCFCENLHFSLFCEDVEVLSLKGLRFPMPCNSIYEVENILNKASSEFLDKKSNEC